MADLDRVERNITGLQAYCDQHGLALRPHVKTHKLPQLAAAQMRAGAAGIACQKLGEAEVMAAAGLTDILVTYPLLGDRKARRLAALATSLRMSVVADSEDVLHALSPALASAGAEVDVLIDCDTGFGRTGVQTPDAAAVLATHASELPGLRVRGLATYPTTPASGPWLREARERMERAGLEVDWVSGGGTPAARSTHEVSEVTELRAGTYVYGDRACVADGSVPQDACALHVVATVVSRPAPGRAIVDAGSKALTSDLAAGLEGYGAILEHPEARLTRLSEEHGWLDVGRCARPPAVGDVVTILPNHACAAVNLYDEIVVHRGGEVEGTWAVAARGRSR
ncbi:MAG TPA: alanine racemase [Gaiellaceae bacterium]|nr:alanine racemase [Gaiellaceae bacterium]